MTTSLVIGFLIADTALARQESEQARICLPIRGLVGSECEQAVQQALGKMESVDGVKIHKIGDTHVAEFSLRHGQTLLVSAIVKALEQAAKDIGRSKISTTYTLSEDIGISPVHLFRTTLEPDENELGKALAKLPGFKSLMVYKIGFSVVFQGLKQATLADVRRNCGLEITEIVFAPSKSGQRYFCLMHPEKAWPVQILCPVCSVRMKAVPASTDG